MKLYHGEDKLVTFDDTMLISVLYKSNRLDYNFYSVSLKQSASRHGVPLGNIILLVFIAIY